MVRKAIWASITAMVLLVAGAGAAAAAPPTAAASSWQSTVVDGEIVGGTRTISVTNGTDEILSGQAIDLTTVPCDCVVVERPAIGRISGNNWVAPPLDPGQTVEITFTYAPRSSVRTVGTTFDFDSWLLTVAMALVLAGAVAKRFPSRQAAQA
jgi:hypothetical protein